jgi:hypothetical protein
MGDLPVHLRFVRRVHRRWVAWRVLEGAGIGMAVAAGAGLVLVGMALWEQRPAVELAAGVLAAGGAAGGLWAALHRPDMLATAMWIDRQLKLHDLLSTVLRPAAITDTQFAAIVAAQADAACLGRRVSALTLRRLGSRAWGSIGIAAGLLLTLALMGSTPSDATAGAAPGRDLESVAPIEPLIDAPNVPSPSSPSRSSQTAAARASARDASNDEASADDGRFPEPQASSHDRSISTATDAAGAASGRTRAAVIPRSTLQRPTAPRGDLVSGQIGGGGSAAASPTPGLAQSTGTTTSAGGASKALRPGQAMVSDPPSGLDRASADPDLAAYRDMLRAYFDSAGH